MEALAQNFMKAFGWSILDSFWQCGIVYGVLLITLLSLPRLLARTRHNLSYLSICIMLVWFFITFISKINFEQDAVSSISINDAAFQQYLLTKHSVNLTSRAEAYFPFIIMAYIIGMILQMIIISKGYLIIQKIKRSQQQEMQDEWKIIFSQFVQKLNITRKVSFKYSSFVNTPMVIGYFKPIILFPTTLFTYLDTEQVEAILIHELSHIRRNDYLLNLIKTFIETILFFNPFVWMAGRFILIEREHACDDMVLRLTGKPVIYANALLKLELSIDKAVPSYTMAATGKPQYLFQRIKRITNMKTSYLNFKQQMAALTLALACLISFGWIRPVENKKTKAVAEKIAIEPIPFRPGAHNTKIEVITDTIIDPIQKKPKIKIVVTDAAGNKKEYNSLKDLPDSLKDDAEIFGDPGFLIKNGDSVFFKEFNSKEWQKQQEDLVKQQEILVQNFAKKLNPLEREKQLQELSENQQKMDLNFAGKLNLPEREKQLKELAENKLEIALSLEKKLNSPEWKKHQEELVKLQEEVTLKLESQFDSREWQKQQDQLAKKYKELTLNLESGELNLKMDTLLQTLKTQNNSLFLLGSEPNQFTPQLKNIPQKLETDNELKNNDDYIKLKEKFDRDVEKLKKKEAKKSNKENKTK